jgi:hypothetical protein
LPRRLEDLIPKGFRIGTKFRTSPKDLPCAKCQRSFTSIGFETSVVKCWTPYEQLIEELPAGILKEEGATRMVHNSIEAGSVDLHNYR